MSFFDGINFWVSDAANGANAAAQAVGAGAAAGAAVAGSGVTMDRDEMTNFLTQVKQTRELCRDQIGASQHEAKINPPAEDPASRGFTQMAQASKEARDKYLQQQLDMYNALVDKLENALGRTVAADEHAGSAVTKAADGGMYS